jgi:flagellar motor switch protein FliG
MADENQEEIKDEVQDGKKTLAVADKPPLKQTMSPDRKAAIAILALGSDLAREIFRTLPPRDIERLMHVAENLHDVTAEEVLETLRDLNAAVDERVSGVSGHEHTLQHVAAQALGQDTLSAIISRDTGAAAQLEMVATRDTKAFGRAIGREHPQICAVVLALLQPDTGSAVLMGLPAKLKAEVMFRIANLKAVPSDILDEIADVVGRDLKQSELSGPVPIDGMDSAVKLLKATPSVEEGEIFEALNERDVELAEEIRSRMFVFEDISNLQSREIQLILREVDGQQLALALKGATNQFKEQVLSNMSSRAALMVLDDIEAMGPISISQVETAQKEIVSVVVALAAEDRVNIRPGEMMV